MKEYFSQEFEMKDLGKLTFFSWNLNIERSTT
jgi:hypothetical protein